MVGGDLVRQVPLAMLAVVSQLTTLEEHPVWPRWIVPVDPRGHRADPPFFELCHRLVMRS